MEKQLTELTTQVRRIADQLEHNGVLVIRPGDTEPMRVTEVDNTPSPQEVLTAAMREMQSSGYAPIVEFDYTKGEGERSHRRVVVAKIGPHYVNGLDVDVQSFRSFRFERMSNVRYAGVEQR